MLYTLFSMNWTDAQIRNGEINGNKYLTLAPINESKKKKEGFYEINRAKMMIVKKN